MYINLQENLNAVTEMGASNSKLEEDKALQFCSKRKKFIRQALDGRCSLATAHVTYIQSLKNTGTALRKFAEPDTQVESSLYTSTNATPELLAFTEKSLSQFSFSSPTKSQHIDGTENRSPTPSPPSSSQFHVNHMRFRGFSSQKVEEKPPPHVTETVTSSSTPQNTTPRSHENPEASIPSGTPPWDYFNFFHPIDTQFSFQEGSGNNQGLENVDDLTWLREEEGIPELEDEEDNKSSFRGREQSQHSEDEFDEPETETLVRSFENLNRVPNHRASHTIGSVRSETEEVIEEKTKSPDLQPLRATPSTATTGTAPSDARKTPTKDDCLESKVNPKDFVLSMKDIEFLFIKASDSGKEVPRMLEANKLHFRPMVAGKESGLVASTFFNACFSCGKDPSQVQEQEPAQNDVKYLIWHRSTSSRSSSSRNPLGANARDDVEDLSNNLFETSYMISGSHASTLDRLYAWERKLYDEVKASEQIRKHYEYKCKMLRQLESKGESSFKIDKTRAVVKDLHSRIRVGLHRIDSISKRIEELRDTELQPQLEELIEGLSRMWEVMLECHKLQFHIISVAYHNENLKLSVQSESRRQFGLNLENELSYLASSFTKWADALKSYLLSIKNWLYQCVALPQTSSRRRRRPEHPPLSKYGPPIYVTCEAWLNKLDALQKKEGTDVVQAIKGLQAEINQLLPRQEKNLGKSGHHQYSESASDSRANMLGHEDQVDWISGFDHFRSSLAYFLGQLNNYAESSVKNYAELEKLIREAKINYEAKSRNDQWRSQSGSV
ncbi:hypothetical protein ACFE04_012806 [Oxalis oulophora]